MNADGSGIRRVTAMSADEQPYSIDLVWPIWSPDGKQLVFEVTHFANADPPNRRAFFTIGVDGTGLRQLTTWSLNAGGRPDWSPDGRLSSSAQSRPRTATTATCTRSTPTAAAWRS